MTKKVCISLKKERKNFVKKKWRVTQQFSKETVKSQVAEVEEQVKKTLQNKNTHTKRLSNVNTELKEELKVCKMMLKNRDSEIDEFKNDFEEYKRVSCARVENLEFGKKEAEGRTMKQESMMKYYKKRHAENLQKLTDLQITLKEKAVLVETLENEKDDLTRITFAEVEKFDEIYQKKIDDLQKENRELKEKVGSQESTLQDQKHTVIPEKEGRYENSMKFPAKNERMNKKLKMKCKKLKLKVKSLSFEVFQKDQENKGLHKTVSARDEEIKLKETKIHDLEKNLDNLKNNSKDHETLINHNKQLAEGLTMKNKEINELHSKIVKNEEVSNLMKKHGDLLNEEYQKLKMQIDSKDVLIETKEAAINEFEKAQNVKEEEIKMKDETIRQLKRQQNDKVSLLQSMVSSNQEFEKDLKVKNLELSEMKANVKLVEEALSESKAHNETLNVENEKLKLQIDEKESLVRTKESAISGLSQKIRRLKEKFDTKDKKKAKLEESLRKKEEEANELNTKIIKDAEKIDLIQGKNGELDDENRKLKLDIEAKENFLAVKEIATLDLKRMLSEEKVKTKCQESLKERIDNLNEELKEKEQEIVAMREKATKNVVSVDFMNKHIESINEEQKRLYNNLNLEQKRVNDELKVKEKEISELKRINQSLGEGKEEFKKTLAKKDDKIQSLQKAYVKMTDLKDAQENKRQMLLRIIKSRGLTIRTREENDMKGSENEDPKVDPDTIHIDE